MHRFYLALVVFISFVSAAFSSICRVVVVSPSRGLEDQRGLEDPRLAEQLCLRGSLCHSVRLAWGRLLTPACLLCHFLFTNNSDEVSERLLISFVDDTLLGGKGQYLG